MTAGRDFAAGDLAGYPDSLEFGFEGALDGRVEVADAEDAALRFEGEGELALFGRGSR